MRKARILIVDDDQMYLRQCQSFLAELADTEITVESDSRIALKKLRSEEFDILITDIQMEHVDGIQLLREARTKGEIVTFVMSAYPSFQSAVDALTQGAIDYIVKPLEKQELLTKISRAMDERQVRNDLDSLESLYSTSKTRPFIGKSAAIEKLLPLVDRMAEKDVDLVLSGDSGVGKEVLARRIHKLSRRKKGRFVAFDCSAVPENLMESELFGYRRGAFTGADRSKIGLVEFAGGGTLFIDEILELPVHLQARLLRIVQERVVRPLGSTREVEVDIRIIAATARDLKRATKAREFREDLYYRLDVMTIDIPPLREREGDVELLATYFVQQNNPKMDTKIQGFCADAMEILNRYPWPGNVRQLQNIVKHCMLMAETDEIRVQDLPERIVFETASLPVLSKSGYFKERDETVAKFEWEYMHSLMKKHLGDVSRAAEDAQVPRGTLYRILKKHGIDPAGFRRD